MIGQESLPGELPGEEPQNTHILVIEDAGLVAGAEEGWLVWRGVGKEELPSTPGRREGAGDASEAIVYDYTVI